MPQYAYIILLGIAAAVILGLVLYFRLRTNFIYKRFEILASNLKRIKSGKVLAGSGKPGDRDMEKIGKLIYSISSEMKLESGLLDSVLDNINQGILVIDGDRKILKINQSLSNLFYIDSGKTAGQKAVMVFNNSKLEELVDRVLKEGIPLKKDIVFYGDEDLYLTIEAIPVKLETKDGQKEDIASIVMIMDNATQEVEFSKLRSQFAANVSHEMRTPLTSIKGYMETVADSDLKDSNMVRDYLSKSLEEVDKLNFLIKDVLDLSKIEYRRNVLFQENTDLAVIIKDIIKSLDFLAKNNKVKIRFKDTGSSFLYNTDEELFRQLVRNLLENSIFYSGRGSSVDISLKDKEDRILLEVSDNGKGIKKVDLPYIFQRFYRGRPDTTAKRIGSGLGLSIVKHIVDLHGGSITAESIPGEHTRFTITLPKSSQDG